MKKFKILLLFVCIIGTYSCKKQYSCTCTLDSSGEVTEVSIYELTEEDAQSSCNNRDQVDSLTCILDDY